jgi:hypothetical protein
LALTGRYDFKGIKKWGAKGLDLALASTSWGAWVLAKPIFLPFVGFFEEQFINWLANKGLVVLNLGAIYIGGELDEKVFNSAMSEALKKVQSANGTLTPEQEKAIDDEVIAAARRFLPYTRAK